jgi:hypothetical protein
MNAENKVKLCNRLAALLMALALICQFVPYWHHGEGMSDSINGYVWFPTDKPELAAYLKEHDAEHNSNEIAWPNIGVMLLCVAGVILCLKYSASAAACAMPILSGTLGTWFYLTTPVMHLGTGWWLHALLFVLLLITGLYGMVGNRKGGQD